MHQGVSTIEYPQDKDGCYTTARKVCSNNLADLIGWGRERGFETKNCKHCDTKRFRFPTIVPDYEVRLSDQEGDGGGYTPQEGDRRQVIQRQIRERRGQQQFRDALRERYGDRCLVTGCEVLAVLEAVHISPYRGEDDNHPENGLLLRSDIHTLFDLDLLGIEPEALRVVLYPSVVTEYGPFATVTLGCPEDQRPSREALSLRYKQFQQRLHEPV